MFCVTVLLSESATESSVVTPKHFFQFKVESVSIGKVENKPSSIDGHQHNTWRQIDYHVIYNVFFFF